jgi:hypothetical protein
MSCASEAHVFQPQIAVSRSGVGHQRKSWIELLVEAFYEAWKMRQAAHRVRPMFDE